MKTLLVATLCMLMLISAHAQKAAPPDAQWVKSFAAPCSSPCLRDTRNLVGQENRLSTDRRLFPLLRSTFHQKEWFYSETRSFPAVADIVPTFIGVPGNAILDDDRYVTADGCVPHVCDIFRGMLWIDTGAHPADMIFAATDNISDVEAYPSPWHLWIYVSSNRRPPEALPPVFLASLKRWHDANVTQGYKEDIALVTLVQPDGGQIDLTYATLFHQWKQPGVKK